MKAITQNTVGALPWGMRRKMSAWLGLLLVWIVVMGKSHATGVKVECWEVTQGVQAISGTMTGTTNATPVTLIAGRPTYVRLYLTCSGTTPITLSGTLTATSSILSSGSLVTTSVLLTSNSTATLAPNMQYPAISKAQWTRMLRNDLSRTLNFRIEPGMLVAGGFLMSGTFMTSGTHCAGRMVSTTGTLTTGTLSLQLSSAMTTGSQNLTLSGSVSRSQTVVESMPFRVRLIGFSYEKGGITYAPLEKDYQRIISWLLRAYPIDKNKFEALYDSTAPIMIGTTTSAYTAPRDVNPLLKNTRDSEVGASPQLFCYHYYGIVPDGGFYMKGESSAIATKPCFCGVASGPTGTGDWGWDFDGSYGDWYAGHEIGHLLGREHASGTIFPFQARDLAGFDIGVPNDIPEQPLISISAQDSPPKARDWVDVMRKETPFVWVSGSTYQAIYNRLWAEELLCTGTNMTCPDRTSGSASATPAPSASPDQNPSPKPPCFSIVAPVNLTQKTGRFFHVHDDVPWGPMPESAGVKIPRKKEGNAKLGNSVPKPSQEKMAVVNFYGASGTSSQPICYSKVPISISSDPDDDGNITGLISAVVKGCEGARWMELSYEKTPLDLRLISLHKPKFLNGISFDAKEGKVHWRAEDEDGGPLFYAVMMKVDDGLWKAITAYEPAPKQQQQAYILNPALHVALLRKSAKVTFKVILNDGVHSTQKDSPAITIAAETSAP